MAKKQSKTEELYEAIIKGLNFGDKNYRLIWDRAIAIKSALDTAGFKIVRKPTK